MKRAENLEALPERFPSIAWWVLNQGWIEIGYDDFSRSFVRALDIGGMVWEGNANYDSLDEAFASLDAGLRACMIEQGFR